MALCEKYKMEILAGRLVCPDPQNYCAFREACRIYAAYEGRTETEEKNKEV